MNAYRLVITGTPESDVLEIQCVKDLWNGDVLLYSTIIQKDLIQVKPGQVEIPLNLTDEVVEPYHVDTSIKSDQCKYIAIADYDALDNTTCTCCGNKAEMLVRTKGSSLLEPYCKKCVPTPVMDIRSKKIFTRLVDVR